MDIKRLQEMLGLASQATGLTEKTTEAFSSLKTLLAKALPRADKATGVLFRQLEVDLAAASATHARLNAALQEVADQTAKDEAFEKEKARYELVETEQGDFVFRIKSTMADEQPVHYICTVCLNSSKTISFLAGSHRRMCQMNRKHVFSFGKTPPRATSRVRH